MHTVRYFVDSHGTVRKSDDFELTVMRSSLDNVSRLYAQNVPRYFDKSLVETTEYQTDEESFMLAITSIDHYDYRKETPLYAIACSDPNGATLYLAKTPEELIAKFQEVRETYDESFYDTDEEQNVFAKDLDALIEQFRANPEAYASAYHDYDSHTFFKVLRTEQHPPLKTVVAA